MNIVEEIKQIKALLDSGKITEEEFLKRKREILFQSNNEDKPDEIGQQNLMTETPEENSPSDNDSNQERPSGNPMEDKPGSMNSSKEPAQISPDHVVAAGRGIQSSVRFLVASYIMTISGVGLFLYSLIFEIFSGISKGYGMGDVYTDSPALVFGSLFMILGIIFWIKYVLRLNKAGRLLKTSSEVSGDLVKEIKKKKPRVERKPNPMAVITAMVAAISALSPLFFHFGMVAGLPNSIVLGLVAIAGGLLAFFNVKWSFLAGAFNVIMGIIALIMRFGNFSSDYIRQFLLSALPIPVIFITASVIFIIATIGYLKTPQYQNNQ
jgi:hypothetical protein